MIELGLKLKAHVLSSMVYFFYAYTTRKNKIRKFSCDQHYLTLTILHDLAPVSNFSLVSNCLLKQTLFTDQVISSSVLL